MIKLTNLLTEINKKPKKLKIGFVHKKSKIDISKWKNSTSILPSIDMGGIEYFVFYNDLDQVYVVGMEYDNDYGVVEATPQYFGYWYTGGKKLATQLHKQLKTNPKQAMESADLFKAPKSNVFTKLRDKALGVIDKLSGPTDDDGWW